MRQSLRSNAKRFIILQGLPVLVLALGWLCAKGTCFALSALLGGLSVMLPNLVFAYVFFGKVHAAPSAIMKTFYIGEMIKLATSVVIMMGLIVVGRMNILPLITGFIGAYIGGWLALPMVQ